MTAGVSGALAGLALRRSRVALSALVILGVGLFAWGTSTAVSNDLYEAARVTGLHVLKREEDIAQGDEGFAQLFEVAFAFAEDIPRDEFQSEYGGLGGAESRRLFGEMDRRVGVLKGLQ